MQETDGKLQNRFLHYGLLFFIFFVGALTLLSHSILHASHHHDEAGQEAPGQVVSCTAGKATYNVIIRDNKFSPSSLAVNACGYLVIKNLDKVEHEPAFGPHQLHQHYPGYEEQTLQQNQAAKIQLVKKGSFTLHDHDNATTRLILQVR